MKCIASRAYHNARSKATREGYAVEQAKKKGREAAAKARAEAGPS